VDAVGEAEGTDVFDGLAESLLHPASKHPKNRNNKIVQDFLIIILLLAVL
jgi:hypothetical protein